MKKKIVAIFLATMMAVTIGGCGNGGQAPVDSQKDTQQADALTEEMQTAQYWIDKTEGASDVLLGVEEIQGFNEKWLAQWGEDLTFGYYDVQAVPEKVEGEWLKSRICYMDFKNMERYHKGERVTAAKWEAYLQNANLDGISTEQEISYAVINTYAAALDLPTNDILTDSGMNEAFNTLQQTCLKINEPVTILHESADGEWVYAVANEFIGWVRKEHCAFFKTRQEWLDYQEQTDFVIVTKDIDDNGDGQKFLMGTKLYLDGTAQEESGERTILLPQADAKGQLVNGKTVISAENVSDGYLPYTRENVLILAFQELGEPYGWGGANAERDCSSYLKDIYACFGFKLPRNSRLQQSMAEAAKNIAELSEDKKKERVESASAGDLMGISGHVMLYLGKDNGKYYVISMLSSYVPESVTSDFANHIEAPSKVLVNTLGVHRKNGNTWLQELTAIMSFAE